MPDKEPENLQAIASDSIALDEALGLQDSSPGGDWCSISFNSSSTRRRAGHEVDDSPADLC